MDSIKPILNLQNSTPKTVGDVQKLVGLLGYYRRYMKDFSRIAKPIYDLLAIQSTQSQHKMQNQIVKQNHHRIRYHQIITFAGQNNINQF